MKTRIATMISIAGVLIAGSAAAMVNTQVLGGGASSPVVVEAASQVQQTTPAVTAAAATPETTLATVAPAATQAVYAIGDSGTVTLDTAGEKLTIIGVAPAAGWTVTKSETDDAVNAEIKFQSGSIEVEFHANLLFGVVTTSIESNDLSTPGGSVDTTGSTAGRYSGDDDDEGREGGGDDD